MPVINTNYMNKASFIPILFISLLLSCGGAKEKTSGDEIPQGNVTFDTYLFVRATVNDTLDCDLVYDTGFLMGSMVDTALVSVMENFTLSIDGRVLEYKNSFPYMPNVKSARGFLAPMYRFNPDTLVWDMNFDRMTLSVTAKDTVPPGAVVIPIERKGALPALYARIPLRLYCGGRHIDTDYLWMIDTGTPAAFVMTDLTGAMAGFTSGIREKADYIDAWSYKHPGRLQRRFEIDSIIVADAFHKRSKSIGIIDSGAEPGRSLKNSGAVGTIGLGILKEFNFMLDLGNDRLVMYPSRYKPESHIDLRYKGQGHYGILYDMRDSTVIRMEKDGVAHKAGVRIGDGKDTAREKIRKFISNGDR